MENKNCQPRMLYPEKLSFRNEGDFPRHTEVEVVHHYYICLTRNAKRSSLS